MPAKNHKALDRNDQTFKILTAHTYTKGKRGKWNNRREWEWNPTTEKPEPKFETRNNLRSQHSIHGEKYYPNLEWQTWRNGEPPKMQPTMKSATIWENKERKGDYNTKSVNCGVILELLREHKSQITKK